MKREEVVAVVFYEFQTFAIAIFPKRPFLREYLLSIIDIRNDFPALYRLSDVN